MRGLGKKKPWTIDFILKSAFLLEPIAFLIFFQNWGIVWKKICNHWVDHAGVFDEQQTRIFVFLVKHVI